MSAAQLLRDPVPLTQAERPMPARCLAALRAVTSARPTPEVPPVVQDRQDAEATVEGIAGASTHVSRRAVALTFATTLALVLAWRILAVNLGALYVDNAIDEPESSPAALNTAVAWDGRNADALARAAAARLDTDPHAARALALDALRATPATAPAYVVLAGVAASAADPAAARPFLQRAAQLEPHNPFTQLALANLALADQDAGAVLAHFDAALRSQPALAAELFPRLRQLAASPAGEDAVRRSLAQGVPPWWPAFFMDAARNAPPRLGLALLDDWRAVVPVVGLAERTPLVDRLASEGAWNSAFLVWLNGLPASERAMAGNLYNGGFEAPFTGTAFDWQWPRANGADIAALPTFGTTGKRALRVAFRGQIANSQLLTQTLLLTPGYQYDLRGRFRLEALRTQVGLEWQVACNGGAAAPLASTDRLVGSSDWKDFATTFRVPPDCFPQTLALTLHGNARLDLQATGLAWYDNLQVIRVPGSVRTAVVGMARPVARRTAPRDSSHQLD